MLELQAAIDRATNYLTHRYSIKTIGQIVKRYDDQLTRLVHDTFRTHDALDMRRAHKALLRDYAEQVFIEGMNEGGTNETDIDDEDRSYIAEAIQDWLAGQLPHVNAFAAATALAIDAVLQAAILSRVEMWVNALRDFGSAGKAYAQANVKGQWVLGKTEEHCTDCLRYSQMKPHRLSWFLERKMPRSPDLACKGFHCDCDIIDPKTKASLL